MRTLFGLFLLFTLPTFALAEQIELFATDVTVQPDGSLRIEETIQYDFEGAARRGIFREIPLAHPQHSGSWYKNRVVAIELDEVQRDGVDEPYTLTGSGDTFRVRIGDPDVTITGSHTYTIAYTVAGALTYYDNGETDFYWNVTGNEWSVPIRRAEATVQAPAGVLLSDQSCYAGPAGATDSCAEVTAGTSTVIFVATDLAPGEGLTVAQALNPELVAQQIRTEWSLWWLWLSGGVLWLFGLAVAAYRFYTAHNTGPTVVAQYEPYQDHRPMFTGVLIDGQLHNRDITAGLLYLAEQGFIKIHKTERKVVFIFETTDYEIELLRDSAEASGSFQQELLALLFGEDTSVGSRVALSSLKKDTSKQRKNLSILMQLRKDVQADLQSLGFYETAYYQLFRVGGVALLVLCGAAALAVLFSLATPALFIGVFILAILTTIVLAAVGKRRTIKGYEAQTHIKGFKEFLSVTGEDRFKFHDAPEKTPEQFTEYLPYAVAFGVEKEWSEVFKDITIPQPSWYDGGAAGGHFVATDLASDLGNFSQSFGQSSGSSSASSGGGSSSGGAGGGGGGSW